MRCKLAHEADGQRTFVVVMDIGDEAIAALEGFARQERLHAAGITGIGAFRDAVIRYFDWDARAYSDIAVPEQVEVAALIGDLGVGPDDAPALHVHVVLGRRDGAALAGHLKVGHVRPTLELVVTETPAYLRRRFDAETGLNLIAL